MIDFLGIPPDALPVLLDAIATGAAYVAAELVKRIATGRTWETNARRAVPVVSLGVGAGMRVGLGALADGADWRAALWRGVGAGAVAIAARNLQSATIEGRVTTPASSAVGGHDSIPPGDQP
jgi:hypothetical protein